MYLTRKSLNKAGNRHRIGQALRFLWRAALLLLVAIVVAAVVRIGIRSEDFPAAHLQPWAESLSVSPAWIDSDMHVPMTVLNGSSHPIEIRQFELSHWPVRIDPPTPLTIPAHAARKFSLHLDVLSLVPNDRQIIPDYQPFEIRLRPITNWGRAPVPWRVHGMARSVASRLPMAVEFGHSLIEGVTAAPQEFDILLAPPVNQFSAISSSEDIRIVVDYSSGETRLRKLIATPQPALTRMPGDFSHILHIVATDQDGARLTALEIPMRGVVTPDIIPLDSFVLMEWKHLGEIVSKTITLVSQSGRAFELVDWGLSGKFGEAQVDQLHPQPTPSTMLLRVRIRVDREANEGGRLQLRLRANGSERSRVVAIPINLWRR